MEDKVVNFFFLKVLKITGIPIVMIHFLKNFCLFSLFSEDGRRWKAQAASPLSHRRNLVLELSILKVLERKLGTSGICLEACRVSEKKIGAWQSVK